MDANKEIEKFVTSMKRLTSLEREEEEREDKEHKQNADPAKLQAKGICLLRLRVVNSNTGLYGRHLLTFEAKACIFFCIVCIVHVHCVHRVHFVVLCVHCVVLCRCVHCVVLCVHFVVFACAFCSTRKEVLFALRRSDLVIFLSSLSRCCTACACVLSCCFASFGVQKGAQAVDGESQRGVVYRVHETNITVAFEQFPDDISPPLTLMRVPNDVYVASCCPFSCVVLI